MTRPTRVYIAAPYTVGMQADNVRASMDCYHELRGLGLFPFAPLWSHFQHVVHPLPYETWMEADLVWLRQCHVVLRLPGKSSGADREVRTAVRLFIPVFYDVPSLMAWIDDRKQADALLNTVLLNAEEARTR